MILQLSKSQNQMKLYQKITSFILLAGLLCFISGFFWQIKYSRLHTLYFLLIALPSLLLIPVFIKESLHKNQLFIIIFIFCLYSLTSVFWAENFQSSLFFKYLRRTVALIILFYSVSHIILKYPSVEKTIFVLLMIAGGILASYSIFEYVAADLYQQEVGNRLKLWGGLNDPISSAMVYGVLLILVVRAYLIEKNKYILVVYLLLGLLFLSEMLLTRSRGPQLALLLSTPIIFLVVKPIDSQRILYPISLITISLFAIFIFTDFFETIFSRGLHLSFRDIIWNDSVNLSLQKPWFGFGLGTEFNFVLPANELNNWKESTVSHSHNIILSTWLYSGVIGVILFLLMTYTALKICFSDKTNNFSILAVVVIFGMLCLLTNGSYPISRANERWFVFWIPLSFIVANSLRYSKPEEDQ